MFQDFRFALRMLGKSPGFTVAAVLCLALGIGANSTVFSLVDGMWLRPLPVRNPGELVYLFQSTDRHAFGNLSYPEYEYFRDHAKSLAGLAVTERRGPILTGEGYAESTMSNVVSESYFTVLGVDAQLGRVFTESDKDSPVVVMSHNLWQRRFGGDPGIVGKTVRLGSHYTVIGVAPRSFRGADRWIDSDFWIPIGSWDPRGEESALRNRPFAAIARLRPGVTVEQARAEIAGLARNLAHDYPQFNKGRHGVLYPAMEYNLRSAGYRAGVLMGIVALVLLIACANVANLLLGRAGARMREIGVRAAVGASRFRLVRLFLIESAVVALLGAGAGLLLSGWSIDVLPAVTTPPGDTYTHYQFRLDSRVLAFTLGVSAITVLAFGLFPALHASRPDLASVLKGAGSDHPPGAGRMRPRSLPVIAQVAVSLVLLAGAGLLVRTFIHSLNVDLGFQRKNVLVAELSPPYGRARAREFYRQSLARLGAMPGVRQVTLAMRPPLWPSEGGMAQQVEIPGRHLAQGEANPQVKFNIVGRDYFRTLGIPLLRGRDFDDRDGPDGPQVAIVSETMARTFWPNEDAVGKFVHTIDGSGRVDRQIAGVVADVRINSIREAPEPYFYLPYTQANRPMMLLAETAGDPLRLANQVRAEIAVLDSEVPVLGISTLGLVIRSRVYEQQIGAAVVAVLGGIGLFLAAIGLYGVLSYATVQRTREIGIRMALGAERRDALRLVLWQGLRLAVIGIAVGLAGALAASSLLSTMLYGVGPRDPLTFACVAVLMFAVALAASYIPARRATRIDPLAALRHE